MNTASLSTYRPFNQFNYCGYPKEIKQGSAVRLLQFSTFEAPLAGNTTELERS